MVDRYYAEALAAAHHRLGIPMGWLGPRKLREIVRGLKRDERSQIQRVHPRFRWLPACIVSRFPWPVELDFAVVERPGGRAVIIVPFKKSEAIVLTGAAAGPYERLADIVRAEVFEDDQKTVRLDHDFPRLLGAC